MTQPDELHTAITEKMVAMLEQGGLGEWLKPWASGTGQQINAEGVPYKCANQWWLSLVSYDKGYESPHWMTYARAEKEGGHVMKGEKGTVILAPETRRIKEEDEQGRETSRIVVTGYRAMKVFNADQVDGLPEKFYAKPKPLNPDERDALAEAFFADLGADIRHGGNMAYYMPATDHIQMPPFETFRGAEPYYGTLAHEAAHWTGHEKRLGRLAQARFGSNDYATEELTAELASAFLCARLGIAPEPRTESAQYLQSWVKVLREQPKALFGVMGDAQKIADYAFKEVERRSGRNDLTLEAVNDNHQEKEQDIGKAA